MATMVRSERDTLADALGALREMARSLDAESTLIHLELVERTLAGKLAQRNAGGQVGGQVGAVRLALVASIEEPKMVDALSLDSFERPAPVMFLESYETPRVVDGRKLSRYQANILHWVEHGTGNGMVGAVAGSGKTTTLTMCARALEGPALFCAFNASIAKELGNRLAGTSMVAKTVHSVGLATITKALGRVSVDQTNKKYAKLADVEAARILPAGADRKLAAPLARNLQKLADFARLTLTDPRDAQAMVAMAERYNVDVPSNGTAQDDALTAGMFAAVSRMLEAGKAMATGSAATGSAKLVDFTDMIWLPAALNLTPDQVPWVFVDECQDLNRAQLELVLKLAAPGGRFLFVGDERQAIYGFAGADSDSFWTIHRRTGATYMALSVCYRCPTSVLDLARQLVPEIEAAPGAPVGKVGYVKEEKLHEALRAGDMVLCHLTAPLVSLCLDLIGRRIPAKVRGREIGQQITALIRKVTEAPGYRWEVFGEYLSRYQEQQAAKLANRADAESATEALDDRCAAIRTCYEGFESTSADHLCMQIDGLFAGDNERGMVLLSTVHRAKGLENPRVFILRPSKLPLVWQGQTDEEARQEQNLRYVAITRAQEELYMVEEK